MQGEPTIETRPERPAAAIAIQLDRAEIGQAVALIEELFGWLTRRGTAPAGAPYFRYWLIGNNGDWFDMEVGIPVETRVTGDGRVIASAIPGGTYASTIHLGRPDRLVATHGELHEWMLRHGYRAKTVIDDRGQVIAGMFEHYLTDPAGQPDLDHWETEVAYLVG